MIKCKRSQLFALLVFISVSSLLYSVYHLQHLAGIVTMYESTAWVIVEANHEGEKINTSFLPSEEYTVLYLRHDKLSDYRYGNTLVMSREPLNQILFKGQSDSGLSLKHLAIFYAISKQATAIYELELIEDNILPSAMKSPKTVGLVNKHGVLINPHLHFGMQTFSNPLINMSYVLTNINPYVEHVVTDRTDIVNILWKEEGTVNSELTRYFQDSKAPPIFLSRGQLSPFFTQNTVFRNMAYWTMFTPSVSPPELGDIYRNLMVQRLLWEINGTVGFHASESTFKNSNELSSGFKYRPKGNSICSRVRLFTEFLLGWTCEKYFTLYECFTELIKTLTQKSFLKPSNIEGVRIWLNGLQTVGYSLPQRRSPTISNDDLKRISSESQVIYTPKTEPRPKSFYTKALTRYCPLKNYTLARDVKTATPVLTQVDILLIVVFNYPHFSNIPNIQKLYEQSVSHIVYCASNKTAFELGAKEYNYQGSFIEADMGTGAYFYRCLIHAMQMDFKVRGYLLIGDDVLINPWRFKDFPLDKIWLINSTRYLHLNQIFHEWGHWHAFYGQKAMVSMFKDLKENYTEKYEQHKANLAHNSGVNDGIFYGGADIAYIPSILKEDALFYFSIYSRHRLFIEIAFHSVLYGMAHRENMMTLVDGYMWVAKNRYPRIYKPYNFFIHPFKIRLKLKTSTGVDFFCKQYLPYLFGVKTVK